MSELNLDVKNPLKVSQTERLKEILADLEVSPVSVTVSFGTYVVDCDERADIKFKKSLDAFAAGKLPAQAPWIMSDGTPVLVTHAQLTELDTAKEDAQFNRGLVLQMKYATYYAQLPLPDDHDAFDKTKW